MGAISTAVNRISLAGRLIGARVHLTSFVPLLVLLALFKLAISDGGRHPSTLTLAQTAVYILVIGLAAAGTLELTRLGAGLLLVTAAAAFSTVWSVQLDASLHELLRWLMYFGIAVATASTLHSPAAARRFVDGAVVIAGWLCLIGLFIFWGQTLPVCAGHPPSTGRIRSRHSYCWCYRLSSAGMSTPPEHERRCRMAP